MSHHDHQHGPNCNHSYDAHAAQAAHATPAHPFHLVDPSPWPIVASIAMLALTLGGAGAMHGESFGIPLASAGFLGVLYVMFAWWRDVIREGKANHHTGAVQHGLRAGMGLFIVSEVMFFVAFFWAYFNAGLFPKLPLEDVWAIASGVWPPVNIETMDAWHLPFLNTLILLLSGTTVTWAHHALLHNDNKGVIQGLACTVALGVIFTGLQAIEYSHAPFGFTDGVFASTFYLATGFHGLHVLIGTLFLAVNLVRAMRGGLTPTHHLGFEFAAWYWHFVDVVWLFLFVFVYWWGGK